MKARKVKDYLGEVKRFMLRRLRCQDCLRLHTEIPDTIQPFKHYDSEAIQIVLDGDKRAEKCVADTSTMSRWKADMAEAMPDISARVVSCHVRDMEEVAPVAAAEHIIGNIKKKHSRWLAYVMKLLINWGHKLCTQFAFCPSPASAKVSLGVILCGRRECEDVKKEEDSG
jgi:hypothetical protein